MVFALLAIASHARHSPPAWMDWMLAGYALASGVKHNDVGVFDPSNGYYLVRDLECDGGFITVLLTRDRREVCGEGYFVPNYHPAYRPDGVENGTMKLRVGTLRSLSSGHGVGIGDTPEAVRARLGVPTKVAREGGHRQYLAWSYVWVQGFTHDDQVTYTEKYTFKAGKLIEMCFSQDAGV